MECFDASPCTLLFLRDTTIKMQPTESGKQLSFPHKPGSPQRLLASVSAGLSDGAQRLSQHLHTHVLSQNPLQMPSGLQIPSQPISQRTLEASIRRHQVLVEEEGVTVAVQVPACACPLCLICASSFPLVASLYKRRAQYELFCHLQARHNVHKTVLMLGATVLGKLERLGHKIKQHHTHAREEGVILAICAQLHLLN